MSLGRRHNIYPVPALSESEPRLVLSYCAGLVGACPGRPFPEGPDTTCNDTGSMPLMVSLPLPGNSKLVCQG